MKSFSLIVDCEDVNELRVALIAAAQTMGDMPTIVGRMKVDDEIDFETEGGDGHAKSVVLCRHA